MSRRRTSGLPVSAETRPRLVIPLILAGVGFAGGVAIAVFYNVALSPIPPDSIPRASKVTMTGPYPVPAETARSYPSIEQVFRAPTTDGRGGDAVMSRKPRAITREERLEKSRIDKIMQICTGC